MAMDPKLWHLRGQHHKMIIAILFCRKNGERVFWVTIIEGLTIKIQFLREVSVHLSSSFHGYGPNLLTQKWMSMVNTKKVKKLLSYWFSKEISKENSMLVKSSTLEWQIDFIFVKKISIIGMIGSLRLWNI